MPIEPLRSWRHAGDEPALHEVLADPLVHLVMRRDGITAGELQSAIEGARASLRRGVCPCAVA